MNILDTIVFATNVLEGSQYAYILQLRLFTK